MLSKKSALVLLIGISCWIFFCILKTVVGITIKENDEFSFFYWAYEAIPLLAPVPLMLLAVAGLQQKRLPKTTGISLIVSGSLALLLQLLISVVSIYTFSFFSAFGSPDTLFLIVELTLPLLFPVALLIFGIALLIRKPHRVKRASAWLIGGALAFLFLLLGEGLQKLVLIWYVPNEWSEPTEMAFLEILLEVFRWLSVLLPVGAILSGLSLLKILPSGKTVSEADTSESPTVGDWFGDFLLSAVPVAGTIMLYLRAKKNRESLRDSWSAAALPVSVLRGGVNLGILIPWLLFSEVGKELASIPVWMYASFAGAILLLRLVLGMLALRLHLREKSSRNDHASVWSWTVKTLCASIPVVNVVFLAFTAVNQQNGELRKWATARLYWAIAMLVFAVCCYAWIIELLYLSGKYYEIFELNLPPLPKM